MAIVVGNGSGDRFRPRLRMATGSPVLAHDVVRGDLELAIVNPSALLTQAYRGSGLFSEPLPVRAVAVYPSFDRFVCAIHPRTGLSSLAQIKERRYPLRVSTREDPTHSTRVLIDQILALAHPGRHLPPPEDGLHRPGLQRLAALHPCRPARRPGLSHLRRDPRAGRRDPLGALFHGYRSARARH